MRNSRTGSRWPAWTPRRWKASSTISASSPRRPRLQFFPYMKDYAGQPVSDRAAALYQLLQNAHRDSEAEDAEAEAAELDMESMQAEYDEMELLEIESMEMEESEY